VRERERRKGERKEGKIRGEKGGERFIFLSPL
jgi:hypothetical protein